MATNNLLPEDQQQVPSTALGTNISFDFKKIKDNLKEYFKNQDEFTDYDFESSTISFLLDILAYNTQMNAMTAHLALNEVFLETAQSRPNLVALAKQLGYLPGSVTSPSAIVNVTLRPLTLVSTEYTIPENTSFSGGNTTWYTTRPYSALPNSNGEYVFTNVELRQGVLKEIRYFYDGRIDYQKFEIPDLDMDINTLKVTVKESASSNDNGITYRRFSTFDDFRSKNSPMYFVQENPLGRYEIFFPTKNEIGMSPSSGNVIELSYLYSQGANANGISSFSTNALQYPARVATVRAARGGSYKETSRSIQANAPNFYASQNRCVTLNDYVTLIKNSYPSVQSVSVWGGESTNPPEYGRVFICLKPVSGMFFSTQEKERMLNETIKRRGMVTVSPRIVDPSYTYIVLDVESQYDSFMTSKSQSILVAQIQDVLRMYNDEYLNAFDKVFRYSQLLSFIDNSDTSIINSAMKVTLYKKLDYGSIQGFGNQFTVNVPINPFPYFRNNTGYIETSPIFVNGVRHYLRDFADATSPDRRNLSLVALNSDDGTIESTVVPDAGNIDFVNRQITLKNFRPDSLTSVIKIYFRPDKFDIATVRDQLLQIDMNETKIAIKQDAIRQYGAGGSEEYNSKDYQYI